MSPVLPSGDVEPQRVELLVERSVVGGEARQFVRALDGAPVGAPRGSKPELALTSKCQRAVRCHSGRSPGAHVSASGMNGSSTAAQYAAIVASGRATRSSESMTTGRLPPASWTAACSWCSASSPMSSTRMSGLSAYKDAAISSGRRMRNACRASARKRRSARMTSRTRPSVVSFRNTLTPWVPSRSHVRSDAGDSNVRPSTSVSPKYMRPSNGSWRASRSPRSTIERKKAVERARGALHNANTGIGAQRIPRPRTSG